MPYEDLRMSHPRPLTWIIALAFAALATTGPAAADQPTLRVLFVGNSLTEYNDLPEMVEAVSRATGGPRIIARNAAISGFSLGDHLVRTGGALPDNGDQDWDFVVLQQGPSSLPESRVLLRQDVARFAEVIRAAGAEPAVYMVWPDVTRAHAFPDVVESYRLAAADVGARLLPAGRAWQIAWGLEPGLALYGPDGFHPSREGSLLAAIVIYEGLTGRSATAQPWKPRPRDRRLKVLPRAAPATLLDAAARARLEMGGG